MSTQKPQRSFVWATAREGNVGKVLETCTEAGDLIYRKVFEMPANLVPNFVIARRRVIAMQMQEQGHPYVLQDSGGVH